MCGRYQANPDNSLPRTSAIEALSSLCFINIANYGKKSVIGFMIGKIYISNGGYMIRIIILCFIVLFTHSICFAFDPDTGYGSHIAIEFKADNKSYKPPIVGHLEYTGNSIDIVSISETGFGIGTIQTNAIVYIINEKKIVTKGLHHIKGQNQYGVIASGTIDFRDWKNPKINLITEAGIVITNISSESRVWQEKNIPKIWLGHGDAQDKMCEGCK